jgi:hypothetical protein
MKLLITVLLLMTFASAVEAGGWMDAPIDQVAVSDAVYLMRVVAVNPHHNEAITERVKFSTVETLRGIPRAELNLSAYEYFDFEKGTRWVLFHKLHGLKDSIGSALDNECEWLFIPVTGHNNHVSTLYGGSLDNLKSYLAQHPYKKHP